MVKAIEAAGLPVVHMCTVTPISMTVGANRIVPTIAIPHPLGNPELDDILAVAQKIGLNMTMARKTALNIRDCVSEMLGEYL